MLASAPSNVGPVDASMKYTKCRCNVLAGRGHLDLIAFSDLGRQGRALVCFATQHGEGPVSIVGIHGQLARGRMASPDFCASCGSGIRKHMLQRCVERRQSAGMSQERRI